MEQTGSSGRSIQPPRSLTRALGGAFDRIPNCIPDQLPAHRMPRVEFRLHLPLTEPVPVKTADGPFEFLVESNQGSEVRLTIDPTGSESTLAWAAEASDALLARMARIEEEHALLNDKILFEELGGILAKAQSAAIGILDLLAQEMELWYRVRFGDTRRLAWRTADGEWREIASRARVEAVKLALVHQLNRKLAAEIQRRLSSGERAFLAYSHILTADGSYGRSAWIEATTAAELAIKEALIQLEPKLAVLLLELPSPPLDKLYRKVLKDVAGEESPKWRVLMDGAVRRNKLIHRPGTEAPDAEENIQYLEAVREAFMHLKKLVRRGRGAEPMSQPE